MRVVIYHLPTKQTGPKYEDSAVRGRKEKEKKEGKNEGNIIFLKMG